MHFLTFRPSDGLGYVPQRLPHLQLSPVQIRRLIHVFFSLLRKPTLRRGDLLSTVRSPAAQPGIFSTGSIFDNNGQSDPFSTGGSIFRRQRRSADDDDDDDYEVDDDDDGGRRRSRPRPFFGKTPRGLRLNPYYFYSRFPKYFKPRYYGHYSPYFFGYPRFGGRRYYNGY